MSEPLDDIDVLLKWVECDEELGKLKRRLAAYERNMMMRDKFLVHKGLYQEFVEFALVHEPEHDDQMETRN